jgi:hypothetical protein
MSTARLAYPVQIQRECAALFNDLFCKMKMRARINDFCIKSGSWDGDSCEIIFQSCSWDKPSMPSARPDKMTTGCPAKDESNF